MKEITIGEKSFIEKGLYDGLKFYEVNDTKKARKERPTSHSFAFVSQVSLHTLQRKYSLDSLMPGSNLEITYFNPATGTFLEDIETIIA